MDGATVRNSRQSAAVPLQNQNLDILMMQPAQDWNRGDTTDFLRLPEIGSISIQREMGSNSVVIRSVGLLDGKTPDLSTNLEPLIAAGVEHKLKLYSSSRATLFRFEISALMPFFASPLRCVIANRARSYSSIT
jgi:hypothetical protein